MRVRAELNVTDLAAAAGFYTDVLGFVLVGATDETRSLRRGGVDLDLVRDDPPPDRPGVQLTLELDGGASTVEAAYDRVLRAGYPVLAPPADHPAGVRSFRLADPDGHRWRITHGTEHTATARTPPPPYTAVIFTSLRTDDDHAGYAATAAEMDRLATGQPGYLGIESAREELGITVSYWRTAADALAWKAVAEHELAQQAGRSRWYRGYRVRVATVEREYGF